MTSSGKSRVRYRAALVATIAAALQCWSAQLIAQPEEANDAEYEPGVPDAPTEPAGTPEVGSPPPGAPPPATPAPAELDQQNPRQRTAKNSVFLEGLGPAILYSINYERMVLNDLGVRAGFAYYSFEASAGSSSAKASYVLFPITASYLGVGNGKHSLEVGGGATLAYVSAASSSLGLSASGSGVGGLGTVHLGYRRQPVDGGFMFRVGVSGFFGPGVSFTGDNPDDWGFIPWGYISFGGTF